MLASSPPHPPRAIPAPTLASASHWGMCYHLVTYIEYACRHQIPDRRHYIDCNEWTCRLSRFHNPTEHDCIVECTEIILPDQSIVMEVRRGECHRCLGIPDPARSRRMNGANGHTNDSDHETETEDETSDTGGSRS